MALGLLPVVGFYAGSTISRSAANTKAGVALNQPVNFSHKHHVSELGIDCRFCHTDVEKGKSSSIPPVQTCMTCHSQIWTNSPLLEPVRKSYEEGTPIKFNLTDEVGWNQVNKLPAFVYFNHSIHIDRGISCNQCHGPIQEMHMTFKNQAFSMAWCLECHNEPEKYLYEDKDHPGQSPNAKVFGLYEKIQNGGQLTPREEALKHGRPYNATKEEIAAGLELVKKYKIKTRQLSDCWTCHR
jgi:Class III cytochrome C family/Cytochrome c7 and related cytochrome c